MNKRFFLFALLFCSYSALAQTSISRAEYWVDNDPGFGHASALPLSDNTVSAAIPTADLSEGWHLLGIRAQGGQHWSQTATRLFFVPSAETAQLDELTGLEYFVDTDPGEGLATEIAFSPKQESFALTLSQMDTLTPGIHTLGLRARIGYHWSTTSLHWFATVEPELATDKLTAVEFWLDVDPGQGNATPVPFTPEQTEFALSLQQMDTLPQGIHTIGLRVRRGPVWSKTYVRSFLNALFHQTMEVSDVEAFWDGDTTNIVALPFTKENGYYLVSNASISTENLSSGYHTLHLRAKADGIYSTVYTYRICKAADPHFSVQNEQNIYVGDIVYILDESTDVQSSTVYAWDVDGDGEVDYTDGGNISHTYTQEGDYTISLTLLSEEGCEATYSQKVHVNKKDDPVVAINTIDLTTATEMAYTGCSASPSVNGDELTINYSSGGWQWAGVEFDLKDYIEITNISFDYKGDGLNIVLYPYLRDVKGNRWTKGNYWLNLSKTDWQIITTYLPDALLWDAADYAYGEESFVKLGFVANPGFTTTASFSLRNVKVEGLLRSPATSLEKTIAPAGPQKLMINNQIFILRDNHTYTITGQEVK